MYTRTFLNALSKQQSLSISNFIELTVAQLVKKFSVFNGFRMFVTVFKNAATCRYPEPDESSPHTHTTFKTHFNIIIQSMPRSPNWSLQFRSLDYNSVYICRRHHACYMPVYLTVLDLITLIIKHLVKPLIMHLSSTFCYKYPYRPI
jgi:hypothetical protein